MNKHELDICIILFQRKDFCRTISLTRMNAAWIMVLWTDASVSKNELAPKSSVYFKASDRLFHMP